MVYHIASIAVAMVVAFNLNTADGFTSPCRYITRPSSQRKRHRFEMKSLSSIQTNMTQSTSYSPEVSSSMQSSSETFDWTKQWYPVFPISYLEDSTTPVPITILNRDFVVWKTADGTFSLMDDSCPHRRAPLSTGKIVDGGKSLACRFHGWEFNAEGSCTKIPMMGQGQSTQSKAFCVKSYRVQVREGLLWMYMDSSDASPPHLSADDNVISSDNARWMVSLNPISFLSMIENSFDPSHAPFTHEGKSFSPNLAIPIEKYELVAGISPTGFALEHSPYQKSPNAIPGGPVVMTTREFLPPCTSAVKSPLFNGVLHFVPSKSGETMVIGKMNGPTKPKGRMDRILEKSKRLKEFVEDTKHFSWLSGDGQYRFASQDRITMQGQDSRKVESSRWEDLTPAKSDAGVMAMQKWMKRYGKSGPFQMTSMKPQEGRQISFWDSHGKYCPQCKRTLKRVSGLDGLFRKVSKAALLLSGVGAALAVVVNGASRSLLAISLVFLVLSIGSRYLSQWCKDILEKVFTTGNLPKYRMMEIYAP